MPATCFSSQPRKGRHAFFHAALVKQWTDQAPVVIVANHEGIDQVWALTTLWLLTRDTCRMSAGKAAFPFEYLAHPVDLFFRGFGSAERKPARPEAIPGRRLHDRCASACDQRAFG